MKTEPLINLVVVLDPSVPKNEVWIGHTKKECRCCGQRVVHSAKDIAVDAILELDKCQEES